MAEQLSTLQALLKDVYIDSKTNQVSTYGQLIKLFKTLTKDDVEFQGRAAVEYACLGLNEGQGYIAEHGELPLGQNDTEVQFRTQMKYHYSTISATRQAIESAFSSEGAFVNFTKSRIGNMMRNREREQDRAIIGDGNGILARVNGAHAAVSVINIDDPMGVTGSFGAARHLSVGMILAFTDGVTVSALGQIIFINNAGSQITLASPVTVGDNLNIVHASTLTNTSMNSNAFGNEPMGFLGMVDNGVFSPTVGGISRALYPILNSRVENIAGFLSADVLYRNFHYAQSAGDGEVNYLLCEPGVQRAYLALAETNKRFVGDKLSPDLGGTAINYRDPKIYFGGVQFVVDHRFPYGMLMGIAAKTDGNSLPNFVRYQQGKPEWVYGFEGEGAKWRQVGRADSWEASYRVWENYLCRRPNACFRIDGITATNVYVPRF